MKRKMGVGDLKYWGSGKDRYQIEVPMSQCGKVPQDWTTKSQKKTHRRYWTPVIENELAALKDAEDRVALAQQDTLRKIFEKFDESRAIWSESLNCISILDALLSLASLSSGTNYCWPTILSPDQVDGPVLDIEAGRHPMLEFTFAQR